MSVLRIKMSLKRDSSEKKKKKKKKKTRLIRSTVVALVELHVVFFCFPFYLDNGKDFYLFLVELKQLFLRDGFCSIDLDCVNSEYFLGCLVKTTYGSSFGVKNM